MFKIHTSEKEIAPGGHTGCVDSKAEGRRLGTGLLPFLKHWSQHSRGYASDDAPVTFDWYQQVDGSYFSEIF